MLSVVWGGAQAQAGLGQAVANSLQDHYKSYHDGALYGGSQGQGQLGYLGVSKKCVIMITLVMILKALGYSLAKASLRLGASKTNEEQQRTKPTHFSKNAVAVACLMFRHTKMLIHSRFSKMLIHSHF